MGYIEEKGVKEYLGSIRSFKPMTKEEEHRLLEDYRNNNNIDARNKLVTSNLKYACSLANNYVGMGLSYGELLSEANSGLIESIDKFDMSYDIKLFSYSKWWIMQRMRSAIEKKAKMPMAELPFDDDSDDDMSENTEVYTVKNAKESIVPEYIEFDETHDDDVNEKVSELMEILDDREADVINMYFGRGYEAPYTLKEIGDKYRITKERARQIVESALKKIRSEAMSIDMDNDI